MILSKMDSPPSQAEIFVINIDGPFGKTVSKCFKYFATSPLRLSLHFQSWFEAINIECKTCTAWHHLRRTLLQNVFQETYPKREVKPIGTRLQLSYRGSHLTNYPRKVHSATEQAFASDNLPVKWIGSDMKIKGDDLGFQKKTAFKKNILTFFYLMSIYTQLVILQSLQSCNVGFHLYHKLWGHLHLFRKMVRQSCPAAPKSFASALWATRCLKQWTNFHVISKKYEKMMNMSNKQQRTSNHSKIHENSWYKNDDNDGRWWPSAIRASQSSGAMARFDRQLVQGVSVLSSDLLMKPLMNPLMNHEEKMFFFISAGLVECLFSGEKLFSGENFFLIWSSPAFWTKLPARDD